MNFIQMGRDTLFGVKDGSTDTFRVSKRFAHDFEVEQLASYPGEARTCPSLVNVNDRYAYMIAGEGFTSCLRYDL